MDLQARKKAFILNFLQLESEKVIIEFEKLLEKQMDVANKMSPMSLSDFQNRINQSVNDSDNGKLTSSESFLDEIAEWK
jgi:hypothetical protein